MPPSLLRALTDRHGRSIVMLGFGAIVGLMLLSTLIAVSVLTRDVERLEALIHNDYRKIDLIYQMRTAARERTVSLQKMLLLSDPFEIDAEWMRFNDMGARFAAARNELLALPLDPEERELLERQGRMTTRVAGIQREIADRVISGDRHVALDLLKDVAVPGQDAIFATLSAVVEDRKRSAEQALDQAHRELFRTRLALIALALILATLSFLIARRVHKITRDATDSLEAAREHYRTSLYAIGDGVISIHADGRVAEINRAAAELIGIAPEEAVDRPVREILHIVPADHPNQHLDPLGRVLGHPGTLSSNGDALLRRRNHEQIAIEFTASPIHGPGGALKGAILVFRDVTQMRALSNQLAYHARHDGLTGLINRREFENRIREALEEARAQDKAFWLAFIDLDQFKIVNDTAGHLAGDELLKRVAEQLRLLVRDSDLVARMGGDEFAVLLRRCDQEGALAMLERIRHAAETLRFAWDDKRFSVSVSIGLVPLNGDSGNLYELFSLADNACYLAKETGRNRIYAYRPDDLAMSRRAGEMQWVHRINEALAEDRLVLYHQPILAVASHQPVHYGEILLRLQDRNGELIPPMAFIPAAERYGLMPRIDRWVIRSAVAQLARNGWIRDGSDVCFSINLSGQSIGDRDFIEELIALLERHPGLAPRLCFEITETAAISHLAHAAQFIRRVRQRGCRFALDDFGSGLSSFGYLKNLPVDLLKIDGSFVRDIPREPLDRTLVESINQIGHTLGMETVAEFVQDEQVLDELVAIGVDFGQGYALARPRPLAEHLSESSSGRTA